MAIKREDLNSSIIDKVRRVFNDNQGWVRQNKFTPLKQIQSIGSNLGYQARDFANQTTQKAWSPTGILGGGTNAIQGGINKLANLKRIELPKPQVQNQIGQSAINLAFGIPESIVNTPRNWITGVTRTGLELGTAKKEGRKVNLQNLAGGIAPTAESIFDIATFGGGTVAKNLLKQGAKQTIKQAMLKQGLKGAGVGAFGGLTYGVDNQYGKDFNVGEVAQSVAGGALLGGVLGAGAGGVGAVKTKLFGGYKKLGVDDNTVKTLVKNHYLPTENKIIKLRQPKAQAEFNTKVNTVLKRPANTPIYTDDLKKYINLTEKLPDTELGAGMSVKSKSKNYLEIEPLKTGGEAILDRKVDLEFEPKNIDIGKEAQQVEIPTTKVQIEPPVPNKVSQSQNILSLPEGEIKQQVVRTKTQLKKVLAENPNANVRIELKPGKGQIATLGQVPDRADVAATLPNRLNTFIDDVLGYSTKAPKGGIKKASLWTRTLREGQEKITTKVEEAMGSENALVRTAASTLQNFFKGLGMSPERSKSSMELRGEMGVANQHAYDVMDTLYKSLKNRKSSLERINAVLDPDISKIKIKFDDLTKAEKQVYGLIREGLDLVHDTSYANGHISPELYVKNKGKYVPRLYDVTELPPEVSKFITQGKKIANDLYKQRKDVDAWKMDNSLNDPVYALGKRLAQVETNSAIKKYTDFLASNTRFISDVERPGFTKLSDSLSYGALSGKYVLNSAAEDLKGFFFSNQAMQNLYDVFRSYDRMGIRQLQKKLLTVFNPTTNVGNIVSDQVFGFVTGVDPFTLNKNLLDLKSRPKQFKQLNDYLMRQGITGTDITRTDFVNKLGSIDDLAAGKKVGKLKTAAAKVQSFYGGTDDAYKVSAFKSLLDKGFSLEEATRKIADGFQNYANVGKFFDLASKTPIIGKPFIKFQGDLVRIIKNGAVNNPLGLITFLGTLWGVARLSSKVSGESDEDRITRENRFAAPMIPGLNIPLTWQTPIGEINVARYISPFYANNETTNIISNMIPFVPNIDTKKDVASNIAMNVNDPLVSPLVQLAVNRDFRGKPISDPDENKYQPSTLTGGEKLTNQASFLTRSYLPPPVNSAIDISRATQGKPNMYGTPQTVGQSIARLGGIKISQYGPEEVQTLRDKDTEYTQYKNESLDKQVNSVYKQQMLGKITPEQAEKRISNLQSQKENVSVGNGGGVYRYIDDSSGSEIMRTVNIDKFTSMPEQTAYQRALKEKQKYTLVDDIIENLPEDQQIEALDALGISSEDATYYNTARQENYLKSIYVEEEIMGMIQQGQSKDQILNNLAGMRKAVNEKVLLADGVINDLVDKNIISYADGKVLKNLDKDLKPKKSGTKAKKPKKVSLSSKKFTASKKKYNPLKIKTTSTKSKFTPPKYVKADLRTSTKLL